MARYADINRADELMAAKTKLEAWRKLDKAAKATAYAAARLGLKVNVGKSTAYIRPFGQASDNFYWEANILAVPTEPAVTGKEENNNTLITNVRTAVINAGVVAETAPTGANVSIKRARKIQFSRVVCTVPKTQRRPTTSRATGLPYNQVETDTVSCPFGQGAAPRDIEQTARQAIRDALKTSQPTARVSFKPQGYVG